MAFGSVQSLDGHLIVRFAVPIAPPSTPCVLSKDEIWGLNVTIVTARIAGVRMEAQARSLAEISDDNKKLAKHAVAYFFATNDLSEPVMRIITNTVHDGESLHWQQKSRFLKQLKSQLQNRMVGMPTETTVENCEYFLARFVAFTVQNYNFSTYLTNLLRLLWRERQRDLLPGLEESRQRDRLVTQLKSIIIEKRSQWVNSINAMILKQNDIIEDYRRTEGERAAARHYLPQLQSHLEWVKVNPPVPDGPGLDDARDDPDAVPANNKWYHELNGDELTDFWQSKFDLPTAMGFYGKLSEDIDIEGNLAKPGIREHMADTFMYSCVAAWEHFLKYRVGGGWHGGEDDNRARSFIANMKPRPKEVAEHFRQVGILSSRDPNFLGVGEVLVPSHLMSKGNTPKKRERPIDIGEEGGLRRGSFRGPMA